MIQNFQAPRQRITEPPNDRWRRAPEHVLRDLHTRDRRLHVKWHAGMGAWQVLEFLEHDGIWSHAIWWKHPYPTSTGILYALDALDTIAKFHRHVQDLEREMDDELNRVRAAKESEREYLKKHAVLDWAGYLQGNFTTSFRPEDRPRKWRDGLVDLPTDLRAEA